MKFNGRRKGGQRLATRRSIRNEATSQGKCVVVRKGTGFVSDSVEGSFKLESLTHGADSNELDAVVATAEPGAACWEAKPHDGEKWYYILEGKLEVLVNDVSHVLCKGDSIYLHSNAQHIWRNPGKRKTKVLVLTSPLSPQLGRMPNESDSCG